MGPNLRESKLMQVYGRFEVWVDNLLMTPEIIFLGSTLHIYIYVICNYLEEDLPNQIHVFRIELHM